MQLLLDPADLAGEYQVCPGNSETLSVIRSNEVRFEHFKPEIQALIIHAGHALYHGHDQHGCQIITAPITPLCSKKEGWLVIDTSNMHIDVMSRAYLFATKHPSACRVTWGQIELATHLGVIHKVLPWILDGGEDIPW
ncbi:hypothetical protein HGA91_00295 [candidate division WWE3 bacterium]|nr:hypothetical protein [candidate division WWE3 bacterium]